MAEGTKLADAYVQIIPVAKGISNNLRELLGELPGVGEESGEKTGEGFASKLKSVIAKAGLTAAIGKVVQEAFTEGAALEQSLGGVETLFKEHADIVKKNAEEAYRTAGLSANEYMENVTSFSASLLSSLSGDTKEAAKVADMAMVDMSDNANKFGTDMTAIQNAYQGFAKENYTMLDNLKLGYGGTKSEMERLLADAEKFSGVRYDISNLNDVYEAIHVIQDNLGVTGTTAKEASSTFSGSFASMKAAAKNLLGVMTTGGDADKAFKNLTDTAEVFFGNVKRMGKAFIDGAVKVFESAVEEALGKIGIEGENAKDVINALKLGIEAAAVGFISFKAAAVLLPVINHMIGLTTATGQADLALKMLNATIKITEAMSPMVVIGGIAVAAELVASALLTDMAEAIDVTDNGIHDMTEETKAFSEQCKKTADKIGDFHEELTKTNDEAKEQGEKYRALTDRLDELSKKSERTKTEQAEMEGIISQLNEDIPQLSLSVDSQTGALKNNIETVGKMADAYASMQAGEDIINRLTEASLNAEKAENKYNEAVEKRRQAIAEGYDITGDEMNALSTAVLDAHAAMETANADVESLKTQYQEFTDAQENFRNGFGDTTQYILNMSDETLQGINDICEKYGEAYQTQHDLVFGQMNLLEEFCGQSDITEETLEKNLQSNIDGFNDWQDNLFTLKNRVSAGVISQQFYDNLEQMGPKGAGYVKAFANMSTSELREYVSKSNGLFDDMTNYVDSSMSKMREESAQLLDDLIDLPGYERNEIREAYEMLGNYATEGYAEGIRNGSSEINDAVRMAIQDAIREAERVQDSHSPSKVFAKLGGFVSEGYALGIEEEANEASRASTNMVRQAIKSANRETERAELSAIEQAAMSTSPMVHSSSAGMKYAFLEALAEYGSAAGGQASRQPVQINVQVGKRTLGKALINDINELTKLNGSSPLI